MRIEVEMPAEGVAHNQDHQSGAVNFFRPLLNDGRTQGWQIVQEVTVALEYGPEYVGHREHHAGELHIRQRCPHFALPECCRSAPATSAGARLAGMVDNSMLCAGCVNLRAERLGAAFQHLVEVGPHGRTGVGPVPYCSRAGHLNFAWNRTLIHRILRNERYRDGSVEPDEAVQEPEHRTRRVASEPTRRSSACGFTSPSYCQ